MSRSTILLLVLGAVALVVASFFFLINPKMEEADELRAEAEDLRTQQTQVQGQITALEAVRSTSPEIEAELAALSAVVPDSPALPSALRQLQVAADDAGAVLVSVAPGRPTSAGVEGQPELSAIPLSLTLEGGYFQVVDFLRRLEDPVITSRGILVQGVSVNIAEYPTLNVTVSAQMFSLLDVPASAQPEPEPTETETDADDTEVDVDVDVTEEEAA